MTKYLIFTISVLIIALSLALCPQNITIDSKAFAQLPISDLKRSVSNITTTSSSATSNSNNATITIHTTNSIQGNNFVIKREEPGVRKVILSGIDNAIFIAKGSVKSAIIPVNVNAKIINQVANSRVDTTQGIDMTKRLIATELINAINTTTTNSNAFHFVQQPTKVAVIAADNQAICTGIASPSKAACSFVINIHN